MAFAGPGAVPPPHGAGAVQAALIPLARVVQPPAGVVPVVDDIPSAVGLAIPELTRVSSISKRQLEKMRRIVINHSYELTKEKSRQMHFPSH